MEPSELKVVINLKENRVVIGVSAPDCDPYLSRGITLEGGDFETRLKEILVHQEAETFAALSAWDERKRNPRYVKPKAAAAAKGKAPVATTAQAAQPQAVAEESLTRTPELPLLGSAPEKVVTGYGAGARFGYDLEKSGSEPEPGPQEATERLQEPPGDAPEGPEAPTQEEGPQEPPAAPEEPEVAPTGQEPGPAEARGGWVYYLKATGAGPFKTVHETLLAHGVSRAEIDAHKWWHRWDRLPKKYQDAIEKRKA